MDDRRYRVRDFLDRDYPALARISNRIEPERRYSEAELRHWDSLLRAPPMVFHARVAEERATGAGVAFAYLTSDPDTQETSHLWVDVAVDPDHQGRGLGRYLADELEAEATRRGTTALYCSARVDRPRDLAFPGHRGFEERRRYWQSRLPLPAPGYDSIPRRAEALARAGVRFTTLREEGPERREVRERVFELFRTVLADEPRLGTYTPSTYEQFVAFNLDSPGLLPEAFFLAEKDGRYVGVSNLETLGDEPGVLHQVLTGTLREYRGLGIATELKRRTVEYGQDHGYRSIRTTNDSLNHPMWAINRKLGYRREVEGVQFEKALAPAR
jgi:mycothiol synthase